MKNKAFSLIELSIVLIIVGIITAGITGGNLLIKISRVTGARLQTKSSPVSTTEDLILWLEPTLVGSFVDSNGDDVVYGSTVYKWRNRVGWVGYLPSAIRNTGSTYEPTLIEEGANGLPTLRFDGDDEMTVAFRSSLPAGNDEFTIFLVAAVANTEANTKRACGWGTGSTGQSPDIMTNGDKWYFTFYGPSGYYIRADNLPTTAGQFDLVVWNYDGTTLYGHINALDTSPASLVVTPTTPIDYTLTLGAFNDTNRWVGIFPKS